MAESKKNNKENNTTASKTGGNDGYIIASTNPGWITNKIPDDKFDDEFKQLLTFYVINTPNIYLSSRSMDLRIYNWGKNVYDEKNLMDNLLRVVNINQCSFVTAKGLNKMKSACEKILMADNFYNNRSSEKIVIFQSKFKDNSKNNTRVKSFFYHLRNSLAHGRFEIYESNEDKDNTVFVMEDKTKFNGNIVVSARMILKKSTLVKWMEILQSGPESINYDELNETNNKKGTTNKTKKANK